MLTVLLLAAMPTQAETSKATAKATAYFVDVDLIIINRVRGHSTSYDDWGRPHMKTSEQWWVSFWQYKWLPVYPGGVRVPIALIDRGWWSCSQIKAIELCSDGYLVESKDGMNVIAPNLSIVDSPYDWEMRHRRIYKPIRRP